MKEANLKNLYDSSYITVWEKRKVTEIFKGSMVARDKERGRDESAEALRIF